jgi:SPP1 family predicted phage head-tail adaptor
MSKNFDTPIVIQRIDENTEQWSNLFSLHARINKAKSDSEYLNAGAIQGKSSLLFEVRYFADLKDIRLNTQSYRILYENVPYNITDYDDYMMNHKTVKLLGESYNG